MDWHRRFTQQARWTAPLRGYLFSRLASERPLSILEIGCGSGAALASLPALPGQHYGLDINWAFLRQAARYVPEAGLIQGDAHALPLANQSFDCAYFHFTLLWVTDPLKALLEARRLVRPGGWMMALAEPDYGGRVDYPEALVEVGRLQEQALRRQGADTQIGRRLGALFHQAGLQQIESGVIGGQWREPASQADLDQEWAVIATDLQGRLPGQELACLQEVDRQAWQAGARTLFVPTFYALGQK